MSEYNYAELRGRIRAKFNVQAEFAKALGLSAASLSQKLNNQVDFTQSEIFKSIDLLGLKDDEVCTIFFTRKVGKS